MGAAVVSPMPEPDSGGALEPAEPELCPLAPAVAADAVVLPAGALLPADPVPAAADGTGVAVNAEPALELARADDVPAVELDEHPVASTLIPMTSALAQALPERFIASPFVRTVEWLPRCRTGERSTRRPRLSGISDTFVPEPSSCQEGELNRNGAL